MKGRRRVRVEEGGEEKRCLFQRPKRGEKKRVKRETRRKTCSPKVGGGGGCIWYRALLECDWMLCCRGLSANLYLHKNSQRWKMPLKGLRVERLWPGWARRLGRGFMSSLRALSSFRPLKGTPSPLTDSRVGGGGGGGWRGMKPHWMKREKGGWEEKGWSRRGTSPGRGEQMTVKGFRRFIHGLCAAMSEWCDTI